MEVGNSISHNILVLGNSQVGKLSFMHRLTNQLFTENSNNHSFCSTSYRKKIQINDWSHELYIECMSCDSEHDYFISEKIALSNGIIFIFDLTDRKSLENIKEWMNYLDKYFGTRIPAILIGNKCDLSKHRIITFSEASELALQFNSKYIEMSAKTTDGINAAITEISEDIRFRTQYI